ncbi:MAG: hypothetical protein IT210_00910 [Armatimonadetes bacterium]|nr:hypothetical protein [Armatimonadota bacterium]
MTGFIGKGSRLYRLSLAAALLAFLIAQADAAPDSKEPWLALPEFAKAKLTRDLDVTRQDLVKAIPSSRDLVKNLQRVKLTDMTVKGVANLSDILDFYQKEIVPKGNSLLVRNQINPERAMAVYKSPRLDGLVVVLARTDRKNMQAGVTLIQTQGMVDTAKLKDLSALIFTVLDSDASDPFAAFKPLSLPLYPGAEQTTKMQVSPDNIDARKLSDVLRREGEAAVAPDAIISLLKVCKGLEINTYTLQDGSPREVFAFYEKAVLGQNWNTIFKNLDTPDQPFGMFSSSQQGLVFLNVDRQENATKISIVVVKGRMSDLVDAFLKTIDKSGD